MQIVEVVLHFAVGQLAVDQVAEAVVVIAAAVVFFKTVVLNGRAVVIGQDIVRRVKGEPFAAGFGDSTESVVLEMRRARPLVGAVGQIAGTVVAVAAFNGISRCYCIFRCLSLRQIVECGDLPFQTA